MAQKTTFAELVKLEPRLKALYNEARDTKDPGGRSFCANNVFYKPGGLKDRLSELVGWTAENPLLRSSGAYDEAYMTIYEALPPCRNCNCV